MPTNPQEIFGRYIHAGALTRDADALAELFTPDGVYESPFIPDGRIFPRRLAGREEIRAGMAAYYAHPADSGGVVDTARSRFVLHTTADPDVFIAEIDTVVVAPDATTTTMSLVQIFRISDGRIALLRDYFDPSTVD
ncbi:nuclear transport factor 2 family protein [Catenuloplanes sp. NPDC051500]|uniref:nuclear transport factor 2 family protein n=1 Tax=Catenuloplanes sp. NPDC051500 TaxID=3363959 RepID=UPI0037A2ED0B